jgi:hypothetical protein
MAAPPVARPTSEGSAAGHPIEAHLEAERAALHAERAAAAAALAADQRRDRWQLLRAAGLGFLLAGAIAVGWNQTHQDEPLTKMCTADGVVTDDGALLTRDPDQDCAWVDADGNLVSLDSDGGPTG